MSPLSIIYSWSFDITSSEGFVEASCTKDVTYLQLHIGTYKAYKQFPSIFEELRAGFYRGASAAYKYCRRRASILYIHKPGKWHLETLGIRRELYINMGQSVCCNYAPLWKHSVFACRRHAYLQFSLGVETCSWFREIVETVVSDKAFHQTTPFFEHIYIPPVNENKLHKGCDSHSGAFITRFLLFLEAVITRDYPHLHCCHVSIVP